MNVNATIERLRRELAELETDLEQAQNHSSKQALEHAILNKNEQIRELTSQGEKKRITRKDKALIKRLENFIEEVWQNRADFGDIYMMIDPEELERLIELAKER